eukprot:3004774-Rhodomonas_salina.1
MRPPCNLDVALSTLCLLAVGACISTVGLCLPEGCGVWEQWMANGRWEGDTLAMAVINAACVD